MKLVLGIGFLFILLFAMQLVEAANLTATVCCERTKQGAFCQNAPADQCDTGFGQVQTSCDSTSFCKLGTCYDSTEGTCLDNTPQRVCNANGGVWSAEAPAQCNLGCCMLGDQAAFVSLVRCKRLSSFLGLQTNFDNTITSELSCVAAVQGQDKGACVYEFEFEKTCKFTTRAECSASTGTQNGSSAGGTFYKDKLCSAEELGTICGPSQKTTCAPGKDEVYFVDTCGNPANIYDSRKVNDKEYWANVKPKDQSCGVGGANAGSASCGNCNYLLGSFCRDANAADVRVTYGTNVCADLNCIDEEGQAKRHGESWCLNDDSRTGVGANSVGSRFFRRICMNGEVVTEPCGDFRAHECIQDEIETSLGTFSQSACRVNRWQDCLAQTEEIDCENTDRRDCLWKPGLELANSTVKGTCIPANTPGLNFWNSQETLTVCGQGNKACVVSYEKGLFGGEKCVDNCECLEDGWEQDYANLCSSLGDCGPKLNWLGDKGFKDGYKKQIGGEKLLKQLGLAEEE